MNATIMKKKVIRIRALSSMLYDNLEKYEALNPSNDTGEFKEELIENIERELDKLLERVNELREVYEEK